MEYDHALSGEANARLESLQDRLRVRFRRPELLEQALVHRSLLRDQPGAAHLSNERLEFLGDAVIGQVVARYLYEHLPLASEGELTLLRTWLVRASTLGECRRSRPKISSRSFHTSKSGSSA